MTASHRADRPHNDPVDKVSNHEVIIPPLPAGVALAAARYVHSHAADPADEQDLLLALGLIESVADPLDATA